METVVHSETAASVISLSAPKGSVYVEAAATAAGGVMTLVRREQSRKSGDARERLSLTFSLFLVSICKPTLFFFNGGSNHSRTTWLLCNHDDEAPLTLSKTAMFA